MNLKLKESAWWVCTATFVLGCVVGSIGTLVSRSWSIDGTLTATAVTALATAMLAALTFHYVRLTGTIAASTIQPCVVVSARVSWQDPESKRKLIEIVAENTSNNVATGITFSIDGPELRYAKGSPGSANTGPLEGFLKHGIDVLGPQKTASIEWGYLDMLQTAGLDNREYPVTAKYCDVAGNEHALQSNVSCRAAM